MSRALRLLGLLLGVAVVAWLVAHADMAELIGVFPRIGWGFLAILAMRVITVLLNAAAWRCLVPRQERPRFAIFVLLRWITEAINATLPAAQIGGDVVRARLLQQRIAAPVHGAASVAVDFSVTIVAEILFTTLGFVLLAWLGGKADWWPLIVCAVLLPLFAWFSWELLVSRRLLAARSAAFLIPSGWGAQEATLVALAAVAGLSPDNALALGLVKRAREFAVGLPGLAAWAVVERRGRRAETQQARSREISADGSKSTPG